MVLRMKNYILKCRFQIFTTKVDKKYRENVFGLGKHTFPCYLCQKSQSEIMDINQIKEGFKMDRSLQTSLEIAEYIRYILKII